MDTDERKHKHSVVLTSTVLRQHLQNLIGQSDEGGKEDPILVSVGFGTSFESFPEGCVCGNIVAPITVTPVPSHPIEQFVASRRMNRNDQCTMEQYGQWDCPP